MPAFADHRLAVETARFGPFAFQVGVDAAAVETALLRVGDAQQRFQGSPLSQVASRLEREIVATSVFGTNSIEGGTLSEEETQQALDLDPSGVQNIEQRRVLNIKAAYVLASRAVAEPDWRLDLSFIRSLHAAITTGIPHECIHPFWDGNGRVGRVIEASLLLREGFKYAPFAQARFYLDQIDRYFTLFNTCRKAADKGDAYLNTDFVRFFLEGMLSSLNTLHDRVNRLVNLLLFEGDLKRRHDEKRINARQYAIATQILQASGPIPLVELRRAPWYRALYLERTDKTKQRDLQRLREQRLVVWDKTNRLWAGVGPPDVG